MNIKQRFFRESIGWKNIKYKKETNESLADTIFGKKHLFDALFTINDKIICNVEINTSMATKMAEKRVRKFAKEEVRKKNIELIKRMLNMKLEPNIISEYLNLPVNEVEKVKLTLVNN